MGRRGQARDRAVRSGRRDRADRARVAAFGGDQAADSHALHFAPSPGCLTGFVYMKMSELKDMTMTELLAKSRDLRQEIFNLRLQQASGQLEKPARLRTL